MYVYRKNIISRKEDVFMYKSVPVKPQKIQNLSNFLQGYIFIKTYYNHLVLLINIKKDYLFFQKRVYLQLLLRQLFFTCGQSQLLISIYIFCEIILLYAHSRKNIQSHYFPSLNILDPQLEKRSRSFFCLCYI